jgi:hypothetical protein
MEIPKDTQTPWAGLRCWVYADRYGRTEREVKDKIKKYFGEWHPHGYDTRVYQAPHKTEKGYWHATIKHYSTCS